MEEQLNKSKVLWESELLLLFSSKKFLLSSWKNLRARSWEQHSKNKSETRVTEDSKKRGGVRRRGNTHFAVIAVVSFVVSFPASSHVPSSKTRVTSQPNVTTTHLGRQNKVSTSKVIKAVKEGNWGNNCIFLQLYSFSASPFMTHVMQCLPIVLQFCCWDAPASPFITFCDLMREENCKKNSRRTRRFQTTKKIGIERPKTTSTGFPCERKRRNQNKK